MRKRGERGDAVENRQRLLGAVEAMLERQGAFSLTELAEAAEVSRATTYRNFASADEAITEFVAGRLDAFEQALQLMGTVDVPRSRAEALSKQVAARDNYESLCRAWGELIERHGTALVHVRSTEGYLARVRRDDTLIGRIHRIVRPRLAALVESGVVPPQDLDVATFYWNLLLDPREMIDLAGYLGESVVDATERLADDLLRLLCART